MKKQSFWEVSDVVVMKRKLGGGGVLLKRVGEGFLSWPYESMK